MKTKTALFALIIPVVISCNSSTKNTEENNKTTAPASEDTSTITSAAKTYGNERIKDVTVEKITDNTYRVRGKAQVFEATLSYVVEDGHYELAKGFTTTDAGAPEFGNFDFNLKVEKNEPNSTLMLILFESSPKDGTRTNELMIPLEQ